MLFFRFLLLIIVCIFSFDLVLRKNAVLTLFSFFFSHSCLDPFLHPFSFSFLLSFLLLFLHSLLTYFCYCSHQPYLLLTFYTPNWCPFFLIAPNVLLLFTLKSRLDSLSLIASTDLYSSSLNPFQTVFIITPTLLSFHPPCHP